jgi:hypothetical protein
MNAYPFEWSGLLVLGMPLVGAACCYGVFRRRIRRAGLAEDSAFHGFVQHLLPYCYVSVAVSLVAFYIYEWSTGGVGGATMMMLIVFGPSVFVIGGLIGCVTWKPSAGNPDR